MPKQRLPRRDFRWNSRLGYAVGLIATDGCLSPDKRHITLTSSDTELIKKFKFCLNKENKIGINPKSSLSKTTAYRIQFGDVVFYDWLIKIGLFPNKSLTLGPLKIDNKYFRDFLRGHIDGDGSIVYYKDKYNTHLNPNYVYDRLLVFLVSGSKKHINWMRDTILELKGIKGSLSINMPMSQIGKNPYYRLRYSTKEAKILLNWIYYKPNLPFLTRKYKIAKPFLSN